MSLKAFQGVDRVDRVATVYWMALGACVLVVLSTYALMRSRFGLALTAIRDNSTAASSLGVSVPRVKRIVYVAAGAGAGMAGGLVAMNALRVTPDSIYSVNYSAFMIFIVVIGGLGTIEGPILGAILFFALQQYLADEGTTYLLVVGAVAILVVLFARQGIWGILAGRQGYQVFNVGYRVREVDR
jgi:branched-chain amino acid transport system permease protein